MYSYVKYKVVIRDFEILDINNEIIDKGEITYSKELEVEGEKVPINISLQSEENENNIFILTINSEKDLCEQQLMPLAKKLANDLLNKIAFYYYGSKVGEPWIVDADFKDKKMCVSELPGSIFVNTEDRDNRLLESLCLEIKEGSCFDKEDYRLFRAAMNNEDVVVRYMFLYQILLFKHPKNNGVESQKMVDNFIKSKFPQDKHMYQKWSDTGREETIYTRLRNQVGHFRGKTPPETRNTMDQKINELVELVKISIYV